MKKCPFCAEDIQDAAIKCRYCGSALRETPQKSELVATPASDAATPPEAPVAQDELSDVRSALVAGNKIKAIKLIRERKGLELGEAKEFAEALQAEMDAEPTSPPTSRFDRWAEEQVESTESELKSLRFVALVLAAVFVLAVWANTSSATGHYVGIWLIAAVWVFFDARSRSDDRGPAWAIGTALLGPAVLPSYLARRPLKSGEVREGGTAWNVLKYFAVFWTLLMAIVVINGMSSIADQSSFASEAERTGAAIGTILGVGMIGAFWFFPTVGALALGLFLKKSHMIETGPTGSAGSEAAASRTAAV